MEATLVISDVTFI